MLSTDATIPVLRFYVVLVSGDYMLDREDASESTEETSIMLIVELTLKRADTVYIDDRTTVADVNDDRYATDNMVCVIYPDVSSE